MLALNAAGEQEKVNGSAPRCDDGAGLESTGDIFIVTSQLFIVRTLESEKQWQSFGQSWCALFRGLMVIAVAPTLASSHGTSGCNKRQIS